MKKDKNMIGITLLLFGGLALAIIVLAIMTFIATIAGFLFGGIIYLITKNAELSKACIIIGMVISIIGLIAWVL
ncbi:MAG: hypothetical protein PHN56_07195 [Candidatus Nanoarchaeia archaeon]|nr:hypothetical protein [Candidatus Nanoarchaeia archaeon]